MFIYFNCLLPVTLHFEIMNSLLFLIIEAIIADDDDIKKLKVKVKNYVVFDFESDSSILSVGWAIE